MRRDLGGGDKKISEQGRELTNLAVLLTCNVCRPLLETKGTLGNVFLFCLELVVSQVPGPMT